MGDTWERAVRSSLIRRTNWALALAFALSFTFHEDVLEHAEVYDFMADIADRWVWAILAWTAFLLGLVVLVWPKALIVVGLGWSAGWAFFASGIGYSNPFAPGWLLATAWFVVVTCEWATFMRMRRNPT